MAIGNRRLLAADQQSVTFSYKDYAAGSRRKTMCLSVEEFVRRFCLHLLPERFVKIRHYGLLGNRNRAQRIEQARQSLGVSTKAEPNTALAPSKTMSSSEETPRLRCPHCGADGLIRVEEVPRRLRWIRPVLVCDTS